MKKIALLSSVAFGTFFSVALIASAQTLPPPNGNVPAPINVGTVAQYKQGTLRIGATGNATSGSKLDVVGVSSTQGLANFGTSELLGHVHIGFTPCFQNGIPVPCPQSASRSSHLGALSPLDGLLSLFTPNIAYAVPNVPTGTTTTGGSTTTTGGSTTGVNPGNTTTIMTNGSGSSTSTNTNTSTTPPVISSPLLDIDGNTYLNGSASLYINAGRIGVGTKIPDSNIGVYSASTRAGITIATGQSNWMQVYQPYNAGQLRIAQGSFANNGVSDIATFQADGKVGIGTTSPATKLDVVGGTEPLYARQSANGGYAFMGYNDSGNYARIGAYNGGWKPLVLNEGGNVGIGTTNPWQKLDVNGAVRVGTDGYSGAGGTTNGIVYYGDSANYIRSVFGGGLHLTAYGNTDGIVLQENGVTKVNKIQIGSGIIPVYWHKCSVPSLLGVGAYNWSYLSTDAGTNNNNCPAHQGGQNSVGWLIPNQ